MSPPFSKGKGFKNDKRNLLESSKNLVVLGQAVSQQTSNANRRFRGRRSRSRSRSRSRPLVPGPTIPVISAFGQRTRVSSINGGSSGPTPWITNSQQKPFSLTGSVTTPTPGELKYLLQFPNSEKEKKFGGVTCAVCGRGFEPPKFNTDTVSDIMKNSLKSYQKSGLMTKRNLEEGWGSGRPKLNVEPQDVVCVGTCGELFHKLCLRDYCSHQHHRVYRGPNCPRCGLEVKFLNCQEIDILSSFSNTLTAFERQVYNTTVMNKELQILWPEANNHLTKLKQEITDAETIYQQFRSQRRKVKSELRKLTADDLGIVMAKITDVTTLKATLDKQKKALEFMQQETLQIMRMYLITILRKLKTTAPAGDFSALPNISEKIPRDLVPVLESMLNDDEALGILSRIVAPRHDELLDEAKQKLLEEKILQKYGKNTMIGLARKVTYTVFSTSNMPEDTEPEEEIFELNFNSSTFASGENTAAYDKSSNATDSVPDITPLIKAALPQIDSVEIREKPPKIVNIMEIIKESISSKRSTPQPPSTQSSGLYRMFGEMPEPIQTSMEVVVGSDMGLEEYRSGACQVPYVYQEEDFPPKKLSPLKPSPAEEPNVVAFHKNSLQIKEILKKQVSDEKKSSANSNNSSVISQQRQQIRLPSLNPSSNETKSLVTEKPPQVHQIVELTTPDAVTGRSWSTVSDDDEQGEMDVEAGPEPEPAKGQCETIVEVKETGDENEINTNIECEGSFCLTKQSIVALSASPPLEIVEKFEWKDNAESETACDDCDNKPILELNRNNRIALHSGLTSLLESESTVPRLSSTGQVAIAIMYIIESSEEEQEDEESEVESDTDQDESENEHLAKDTRNLNVLGPVYLTADKTSNYSIIADQKSDLSAANSNEKVPTKVSNNDGEMAAHLDSSAGSYNSSIILPPTNEELGENGINVSESFGLGRYSRPSRKMSVSVSYENEKVIKRTQKAERKLFSN